MSRLLTRPLLVTLALALVACAGNGSDDEFNAGGVEQYALMSITTYTDGDVADRPVEGGDYVLEGTLVFHLVRLESGEFIALSARDPHSDCWVPWQPDVEFEGRSGWFRDPCEGSTYNEQGARVAGPATRDLDRHPVEVRDGEVVVNLAPTALVAGQTRVETVEATPIEATALPTTPSPTAAAETATPSPSPTPTVEPTPTSAPTEVATPTSTPTTDVTVTPTPSPSVPAPADGSPFGGADLVAALAAAGIGYGPQPETRTCAGGGAQAVVYGPAGYGGDPDWPEFTLWVYASPEALRADWETPSSGPPRSRLDDCGLAGTFVFWNANLLIDFGARDRWAGHSALREEIREIFLSLG